MKKWYSLLLLIFVLCVVCVSCSCNSGDVSLVSDTADTDYTALPGEPTNTPKIIIEIVNELTDAPEFTDATPTEPRATPTEPRYQVGEDVYYSIIVKNRGALYGIPFYRGTDHFIIHSHEQDRDFSETMADILETFYGEITRDLKYELSNKTEIIVYPTWDDMPIGVQYSGLTPPYVLWKQLHVWSARDSENPFGISTIAPLAKYYFAILVLEEMNPGAYHFLRQGTAAYASGLNLDVFSEFKEYLDNNSLPKINELFTWNMNRLRQMDSEGIPLYEIASAFVEYTVNGFGYGALIELIKTGDRKAVFGMDDEQLHEAWTNFVRERYN